MTKQKEVTVFSTESCPWCAKVKEFLKEEDVKFKDINVSNDQKMAQKMIEKSGQMGVPQIWVEEEIVVGFDKARLKELLDL